MNEKVNKKSTKLLVKYLNDGKINNKCLNK